LRTAEVDLASFIRLKRVDIPFILVIFSVSFLFFTLFSYLFFQSDFFHLRVISYAEKARLALEGSPPRLENVGFVYPPLPVLITMVFRYPWLTQGVVASLVYTVALYVGFKFYRNSFWLFAVLPLFLPFLYLSLFRFDVLLFFFLIAMSTYLLLKYWETDFSLYLFVGGILFGLAFFVDFSAIYLVAIYGLFLLFRHESSFSKKLGIALVFLLPSIFFFVFTLFINYVFKGDPFYFLNRYFELFQDPLVLQAKSDFFAALALVLEFLNLSFPLILPYLVGFFLVKNWRDFYFSPFFLIYVAPLLVVFLQLRAGTFSFSLSNSVIFIFFLLLFINRMKLRWPIYLAVVISFISAPFVFLKSPDRNEVNFARAVLGKEFERNLHFYREVAREINRLNGRVILDDKSLYPAVYFVLDIKRLVLPYQYEFYGILANPCPQVDYAVGVVNSNDAVYKLYPELASLKLDGCKFYGRVGDAIFFSCSPPCYSDTYLY